MEVEVQTGTVVNTTISDIAGILTAAVDIEVGSDGRIFVVVCCEPATGAIYVLDRSFNQVGVQHGLGIDILGGNEDVAIAGIEGLDLFSSTDFRDLRTIGLAGSPDAAEWPEWSPDGQDLAYTSAGTLRSVEATARSLAGAEEIAGGGAVSWYSPVVTKEGVVAIRSETPWTSIGRVPDGPSSLVEIGVGGQRVLYESRQTISSLAMSDDGATLLWIEGGDLLWGDGQGVHRVEGDFITATWLPGASAD